ncbi:hypothetical protein K431DRAFT_81353 [Polychaeton citri CBS 116435]|uniref:Uncharacterized protein n=1 Tax=Polychaeton citri CBS 116435 TaxID=1314669 RepID=A0A9P4QE87_9PEZI|nr:hypothetical protein K431DRAFT_81353 [Polychaeton citri CBS 116435]
MRRGVWLSCMPIDGWGRKFAVLASDGGSSTAASSPRMGDRRRWEAEMDTHTEGETQGQRDRRTGPQQVRPTKPLCPGEPPCETLGRDPRPRWPESGIPHIAAIQQEAAGSRSDRQTGKAGVNASGVARWCGGCRMQVSLEMNGIGEGRSVVWLAWCTWEMCVACVTVVVIGVQLGGCAY